MYRRRRIVVLAVLVTLLASAAVVAWFVADEIAWRGRIMPGVVVGDTDVGGLTPEAAAARLSGPATRLLSFPVPVRVSETEATFEPRALGASVAVPASVAAAMRVGRGEPFGRLAGWLLLRGGEHSVAWVVRLDPAKVATAVGGIGFAGRVDTREPGVAFDGTTPRIDPPVTGHGVSPRTATPRLARAVGTSPRRAVRLAVTTLPPRFGAEDAAAAVRQVQKWISAPVDVSLIGGGSTTLTPDEIAGVLQGDASGRSYKMRIAPDGLDMLLRSRFPASGTPPVDARFVLGQAGPTVMPGRDGFGCCADDSAPAVEHAAAAVQPAERVVILQPGIVHPRYSTEALQAMGVSTKLGEFTTKYLPGEPRVDNIHKISDMFHGTVVMPGEQVSVNKIAGPRTVQRGWRNAPSLLEGDFTESAGGGISQFATTLYNALYLAGIEIDEHHAHSAYISRYPLGRDATLTYPGIDLVFTNDTPGPFVVWTSYTTTSVTVSLWGRSDGRTVEATAPVTSGTPDCKAVNVVRVIHWPDGGVDRQPYVSRYQTPGGKC